MQNNYARSRNTFLQNLKYNDRSDVMILNILCFIVGTMLGITLMCIVQINRKKQ